MSENGYSVRRNRRYFQSLAAAPCAPSRPQMRLPSGVPQCQYGRRSTSSPRSPEVAMPVEFVGMIGVRPEGADGAAVHVIGGAIDPVWVRDFSRAHEGAGF